MFTGIITDLGRVREIRPQGDVRMVIETAHDMSSVAIGASIACSGACLTVIEKGAGWFAAMASAETLACTILGDWQEGTAVNLERALRLGDELGGHMVSGHVDGVAHIIERRVEGDSVRFVLAAPAELAGFVAPKGSIVLNGVSLTVNEVEDGAADGVHFGVNIISHTAGATTFGAAGVGDRVNVEIDVLARYVARALNRN